MTREEAIEYAESKKMRLEVLVYNDDCKYGNYAMYSGELSFVNAALSALRPVSRERVERMWPGCEACKDAGLAIGEVQFYGPFEGSIDVSGNMQHCPNCGRPITPAAQERQLERLEALKDGTGD